MNFLESQLISGDGAAFDLGNVVIPAGGYAFDGTGFAEGPVSFGIRPEHVVSGEGAAEMPFHTTTPVEIVEPMGSDTLVWGKIDGQNFTFRVKSDHQLKVGDTVQVGFDPARASVFNASGDRM
jgi:multiple sugar transport system ATP-binding protein